MSQIPRAPVDISVISRTDQGMYSLPAHILSALHTALTYISSGLMVVEASTEMPPGRIVFSIRLRLILRLPYITAEELEDTQAAPVFMHLLDRMRQADGHAYPPGANPILYALQTGEPVHRKEVLYRHVDGTQAALAIDVVSTRNAAGGISLVTCTFDDVTAYQQATQSLRQENTELHDAVEALQVAQEDLVVMRLAVEAEQQRYRELFEFAADGYLITNTNGVILEANSTALAKLGLRPNYARGKVLANYIALPDRIRFRALLNQMNSLLDSLPANTGSEPDRIEWEGRVTPRYRSSLDVILTVMLTPSTRENDATLRWILRDVTERKRLERARIEDQTRLLEQERKAGSWEERNRIAQEFHDTLAQGFSGIAFLLAAAEEELTEAPAHARAQIAKARQVALQSVTNARRAIRDLRPQALENGNLVVALASLVDQTDSETGEARGTSSSGNARSSLPKVENDLLRIGQEALTNVVKHAQAEHIMLQLIFAAHEVQLRVTDDGCGFAQTALRPSSGFGLLGMRERTERIGGRFSIDSSPGNGTTVQVTVPLEKPPKWLGPSQG